MIEVRQEQNIPQPVDSDSLPRDLALPRRPRSRVTAGILFLSDAAMLALAALLSGAIWPIVNPAVDPVLFFRLWPMIGVVLFCYLLTGVYPGAGLSPVDELRRQTRVATVVYLAAVVLLFLLQRLDGQSRGIFISAWLLSVFLVPVGRAVLRHFVASKDWWGVPILVLGAGKTGQLLVKNFTSQPGLGFKVVALFDDREDAPAAIEDVPVVGPLSRAPELARRLKIDHAILAMPGVAPARLGRLVRHYGSVFGHLIVVPNLFGMASLNIDSKDLAGVIGLHSKQNLLNPVNRALKRCLELLLLVPIAILSLPVIGLAALWIVIESPGSPFYAQRREGFGGKPIWVWKLRTMHLDADELLEKHLAANPEVRLEWESFYKLRRDPRIIPRIGALLRRTSLDELPQIWNVLRSEMSLVGPRPFPYYHIQRFDDEFRTLRSQVRPGITGLWQVSTRSEGDLAVQEQLDTYYIRNWSLWLDVYILARTPWSVLNGKGAR